MGIKEGFDTTIGIIGALSLIVIIGLIIYKIPLLIRWLFPKIKWLTVNHPIISFFILIIILAFIATYDFVGIGEPDCF